MTVVMVVVTVTVMRRTRRRMVPQRPDGQSEGFHGMMRMRSKFSLSAIPKTARAPIK